MDKQPSQRSYARLAGLLYLIVIVTGGFAQGFVRERLLVAGDAVATAANVASNEQLVRLAFAADAVMLLCGAIISAVLYDILKVVSRPWALACAFIWIIHLAIQASGLPFHIAGFVVLNGSPAFSNFDQAQLQSLCYLLMRLHSFMYTVGLLFFGAAALITGALIVRASFFPRFVGVLMCVAGLCYLVNSALFFIAPQFSSMLLLAPVILGEGALTLWLIFVGLNEPAWRRAAGSDN